MGLRWRWAAWFGAAAALWSAPALACLADLSVRRPTPAEILARASFVVEATVEGVESRFTSADRARVSDRVVMGVTEKLWGKPPERFVYAYERDAVETAARTLCPTPKAECPRPRKGQRLLVAAVMGPSGAEVESLACYSLEQPAARAEAVPLREAARAADRRIEGLAKDADRTGAYAETLALAEALADYGDPNAAEAALRRAMALDPAGREPYLALAALAEGGRRAPAEGAADSAPEPEGALRILDDYLKAYGEDPRVRRERDRLALGLGAPVDFSGADLRGLTGRAKLAAGASAAGVDFSRADLEFEAAGADLKGASFRGARLAGDLTGAKLAEADFTAARAQERLRLNGADLSRAKLRDADFSRADLGGARLAGADLAYAQFAFANLAGADLKGAFAPYATFFGADLSGADLSALEGAAGPNLAGALYDCATKFSAGARWSGAIPRQRLCGEAAQPLDFRRLRDPSGPWERGRLDLAALDLRGADFSEARLSLHLAGANLRGAVFDGADLALAHFGAGGKVGDFTAARFRRARVSLEELQGAPDFSDADFSGADVTIPLSTARSGLFKGARFAGALLRFAPNLESGGAGALLAGADLKGAEVACDLAGAAQEQGLAEALEALREAGAKLAESCP